MDSLERTTLALNHEEPDRVPLDYWSSSGFDGKLQAARGLSREAFLDRNDVDLRYIAGPRYIGPPLRTLPGGVSEDIWGVHRTLAQVGTAMGSESYQEVSYSPLASAADVEAVLGYDHWPSPDWFDYSDLEAQCRRIRDKRRVVVFMGDRLNRLAQLKPAMYLRGVEQILLDMAAAPEVAHAIFGNISAFYLAYAERIFESAHGKIDLLLTGDDFGSQNGPLVSPRMWAQFLGRGFAAYIELGKSYGVRVMHHTCGAVRPIIPLMMERGLDVLQSLQPEAAGMDPSGLKAQFGERLSFHGGVSIQQTLPFGTPDDVRREVKERIAALAGGGGYVLCTAHNVQADVPVANVEALFEAHRAYGRY